MNNSMPPGFENHKAVQDIARSVLADIGHHIHPGASEQSLHDATLALMIEHGATGYWGNTPAFVLAGDRLRLSVFDSSYAPSTRPFGDNETITIDVGPRLGTCFGDCARTYFLRGGLLTTAEQAGPEEAEAMALEQALHGALQRFVTPTTTFSELYFKTDTLLRAAGYKNLDLLTNFGHSLEMQVSDFIPIDASNQRMLGSVDYFTFEPHIARIGSPLAVKHEEMYCFVAGALRKV